MRDFSLDIIRSIAIIFVICIHSMGKLNILVTAFFDENAISHLFLSSIIYMGVPLFVMLSGALLLGKEEKPNIFFKKRFKRIMIPFFLWSIIVFVLNKITNHQFLSIYSIKEFTLQFLTNGVHGIYWYIYMLIGLYLLTPILQKLLTNISSQLFHYTLILIITFIITQYTLSSKDMQPLLMNYSFQYLIYIGYYIGGYYLYTHKNKFVYLTQISIYGFCIFYLLGILNNIHPYSKFPFLFFQSLCFFGIIISTKKSIPSNKNIWNKLIQFISSTSYGIYLSHFLLISILCKIGYEKIIPTFIEPILMTFTVLILELILQYLINKTKLKKILM